MWQPQMQDFNLIHSSDLGLNDTVLDDRHGEQIERTEVGKDQQNAAICLSSLTSSSFDMYVIVRKTKGVTPQQ